MASTRLSSSVSRSRKAPVAPGGLAVGDVLGVGGEDFGLVGADRLRHGGERAVLLLRADASASTRAAAFARRPIASMAAAISGDLRWFSAAQP